MSRWRVRYRRRGKVDRVVRVAWYGDDDSSGGVVVAWRAVVVVGAVSVSVSVLSLSRAPTRVSVSRWGSASRRRARSPGGFSRGEVWMERVCRVAAWAVRAGMSTVGRRGTESDVRMEGIVVRTRESGVVGAA
jgi:hypothetical protein